METTSVNSNISDNCRQILYHNKTSISILLDLIMRLKNKLAPNHIYKIKVQLLCESGSQILRDIQSFMDQIDRFSQDDQNIENIKFRSYHFAQECELTLREFQQKSEKKIPIPKPNKNKNKLFKTFDKTPQDQYFTFEGKKKSLKNNEASQNGQNNKGKDTFIVIQNNVSNHWNQSISSQKVSKSTSITGSVQKHKRSSMRTTGRNSAQRQRPAFDEGAKKAYFQTMPDEQEKMNLDGRGQASRFRQKSQSACGNYGAPPSRLTRNSSQQRSAAFIEVAKNDETWSKLDKLYKMGKSQEQIENLDISMRNKEIEKEISEYHDENSSSVVTSKCESIKQEKCNPLRGSLPRKKNLMATRYNTQATEPCDFNLSPIRVKQDSFPLNSYKNEYRNIYYNPSNQIYQPANTHNTDRGSYVSRYGNEYSNSFHQNQESQQKTGSPLRIQLRPKIINNQRSISKNSFMRISNRIN